MKTPPSTTPRQRFLQRLAQAQADGSWQRLVLSRPHVATGVVLRVLVRPLLIKGQAVLSFVDSQATCDITKNLPVPEALARLDELLGEGFRNAHLFTNTHELQLKLGKKGRADAGHLTERALDAPVVVGVGVGVVAGAVAVAGAAAAQTASSPSPAASTATSHDRVKQRWIEQTRPFLTALGITTAQHQLVPAMARKWKQINKFVEIFAQALQRSPLKGQTQLRVVDFGAGKAYLSFAVHDWLTHGQGLQADVVGVELRSDLVQQGQAIVQQLNLQGMRLLQGDVRDAQIEAMDVMIALHACDTATDHAIHLGVKSGASVILCSPCCHKQLRAQLLSPHPLRSVFAHGIHAEQQAEMVTDSLRALLLETQGYDTQVFEFVALEHTAKNKMILAIKRPLTQVSTQVSTQASTQAGNEAWAQVDELKRYFGIKEQALETLLRA